MVVTKEILDKGINEGCVLCYEQCRVLGMLYPPSHTWRKKFIGKEMPEEIINKYLELKNKTTINPKVMKRLRAKEFRQKGVSPQVSGSPYCEPTLTADGERVIVTEEWIRSGMVSGIGIKSSQAKVLGVNTKRSGWLRGLIGSEIPKETAEEFIRLKFGVQQKQVKAKKGKEATKSFKEEYLKPNGIIKDKTVEGGFSHIRYLSQIYDKDKVIHFIKNMKYKDFLKTPYWKAIADFQKYSSHYACVICGSKNVLNVHHTTYKNHGDEALYLEDLMTVCRDCHKAIHGIK